jgi:hypothetical protein
VSVARSAQSRIARRVRFGSLRAQSGHSRGRAMVRLSVVPLTGRQAIRIVILVSSAGAAGLLWRQGWTLPAGKADVVWQVGLGLFSALLTALTIVFAVTTTPQTRWPSFGDLVAAIAVTSWLVAAGAGVLFAAAGEIWSNPGAATVGAVLTAVALGLGMDTLLVLMRFRSGAGRRTMLTRLTTRRLHRAAADGFAGRVAEWEDLADLREEIEYSIDRGDVAELAARVDEVVAGWSHDETPEQARHRLALVTHLLERLGRSVLYESLHGDAARAAVPRLVEGALHASWQMTSLTFPRRRSPHREEVVAAVALGQICRVIGWLQQSAHERLQLDPRDTAARQIVTAVGQGRSRIVQYVDPDPPGFFRTARDPWPYGFSDPTAVLLWLTAMCEFGGSHVGSGLYIACEVLTGEKFFGNYWHGDCILSEIEARIGRRGDRAPAGREPISSCGDLGTMSLELASIVIAGLRNRRFTPPEGWEDDPNYSTDRRYLRSQLSMFASYDCLSDVDAARDWLVEALTSAPTQPSLTNRARDAFEQYSEPTLLPMRTLGERPAAVTLAALARLAFHRPSQAYKLAATLPSPLVAGALQHARFVFSSEGSGEPTVLTWGNRPERALGPRRDQERELMDIVAGVLADD